MKLHLPLLYITCQIGSLLLPNAATAQDVSIDEPSREASREKPRTFTTFKAMRLVNGHSTETARKSELELIMGHRFGRLNSGLFNLWGLDESYLRLGFDYGITDRLAVGIGRSSYNKIYDGYLKYKLVVQNTGAGGSPVTITGFASTGLQAYPPKKDDPSLSFFDRATYTYQVLIGRKFSESFFLQVSPTLLHTNRVDEEFYNHDQFAIGGGGRYKVVRGLALSVEYYYRVDPKTPDLNFNSLGVGFDIETAGHVFQMVFSNTQGMIERTFVAQTAGQFFKGDIHFGFNITRNFQLKRSSRQMKREHESE